MSVAPVVGAHPEAAGGAAIELAVLTRVLQCELCALEVETGVMHRFGQDEGFESAAYLIFDGIHYDALLMGERRLFSSADDGVRSAALAFAEEQRRLRRFTNPDKFSLRCLVCQEGLEGQREAQAHARETGHSNFGEY